MKYVVDEKVVDHLREVQAALTDELAPKRDVALSLKFLIDDLEAGRTTAFGLDLDNGGVKRFRYITDDEWNKERLDNLVLEKGLSRGDLGLILKTICLNPDIFLPYEK